MVSVTALWLPILISAVFVFVASSILHMLVPLHRSDYQKVPGEKEFMAAVRKFKIPPGDYLVPCAGSPKEMSSPEFVEKRSQGPVLVMTVMRNGPPAMGPSLAQWFVYCVVVGVFAAYLSGRALGPGVPYRAVFRFAGATAFVGYGLALWQNTIWFKRSWMTSIKYTVDSLVYALLTAGVFGWLWPR